MKGHGANRLKAGIIAMLAFALVGTSIPVYATTEAQDLAQIKASVEKRLEHDHIIPQNEVSVQVADGTITLTGTVESIRQKRKAGDEARHVERDYVVDNQLTVKSSALTDVQLQKDVMKAVNQSIFYGVFDWVTAKVKDGNVTLEGVVDQPWHKGEIARVVEAVKGIHEIINRIDVLPPSMNDEEIRHAAARAIYHELYDEAYQDNPNPRIHIIVYDGDVTLAGDVWAPIVKQEAENLVYYWTTAGRVTNDLTVQ